MTPTSPAVAPLDPATRSLLADAAEAVIAAQYGSVSLIQRRVRVGFATGARLLALLEEIGVVGPADQARRVVLVRPSDRDVILSQITAARHRPDQEAP